MMSRLGLKVIRGSQKDLVMAILLVMSIFAIVVGETPVSAGVQTVEDTCNECFPDSVCIVDDEGVPKNKPEAKHPEQCASDSKELNYCMHLKEKYKRGFLTAHERSEYCMFSCDFLKVSCMKRDIKTSRSWLNVEKYILSLLDDTAELPDIIEDLTDETLESWNEVFFHQWSIFLCIVPIVANQFKYYNFWGAICFLFGFLLLHATELIPWDIAVHNIAISFICIVGGAGSTVVYESLVSTIIMLICLYCCFVSSIYVQLIAVCMILVGFCALLYLSFYQSKGRATLNMLMLLIQVYLLYCQVDYLRQTFAESSLVGVMIEICLNAIVPNGTRKFWYLNAVRLTISFVSKLSVLTISKPLIFLAVFIVQFCLFLGFRAFFGAFCLYVLRYKFTFESIVCGLYVYLSDFFGSLRCIFRILFNFERINAKRVCYALGSLFLLYREITYAREFAFIRFMISSFDAVFVQSSYYKASHYLELNVNFMRKEFPQQGSMPWLSISLLDKLARFTSIVKIKTRNGYRKGVGCVLRFKETKPMLVTVDHIVNTANSLFFKGKRHVINELRKLGEDDDPVVCFNLFGDEFSEAPVVDILSPLEYEFIDTLVFINCDEYGESTVCFVPEFKKIGNNFFATVDLDYGDSGGPCFAVLKSGAIRYCGAVSKGNSNGGGGNIVSLVNRPFKVEYDSSDDEMTESLEDEMEDFDLKSSVTIRPSVESDEYGNEVGVFDSSKQTQFPEVRQFTEKPIDSIGTETVVDRAIKSSEPSTAVIAGNNGAGGSPSTKRVKFKDALESVFRTGKADASTEGRDVPGTVSPEKKDDDDRAIKIRNLRKLGKAEQLYRVSKLDYLHDFLSEPVNAQLVKTFSNNLIWTHPLESKYMDRSADPAMQDAYIKLLMSKNPSLPSSFVYPFLDQGRADDSGNSPLLPDEDDAKGNSKRRKRKNAKARYKDRAFRKRALSFGQDLFDAVNSGAFDKADVEKAFNHIVSGHSIDLKRNEMYVVPGGERSWHYINLHDANGYMERF